ncbi:hypothetical protein [Kineococcus sp. SYSU DK001]|uniref:hypothetical protein n=1 Tax=Kineococcus sp. SYSU DK001 TaxID=3383122 RepID=UPI003D7DD2E9
MRLVGPLPLGEGSRPVLVVAGEGAVHVSRGEGVLSSVAADGTVRGVACPDGTDPHGLAVTPGGLRFTASATSWTSRTSWRSWTAPVCT